MAKRTVVRKGKPVGRYGQFILRGNPVRDASKVLCLVSQGTMDTNPNKYFSIKRNNSLPRL